MSRTLPVLAIASAALAALSALVFIDMANLLTAVVAIAAAVFLILRRDLPGYVSGGVTVLLVVLGTMGVLTSIATENGELDFGIASDLGQAFLVGAGAMPAAGIAWARLEGSPAWQTALGFTGAGLALILAIAFRDQLPNQQDLAPFVVALAALAVMVSPVLALRE